MPLPHACAENAGVAERPEVVALDPMPEEEHEQVFDGESIEQDREVG